MADNFSQFYSGNMAPPDRMPDGSLKPATNVSPQMSIADMYSGIYGAAPNPAPEGLSTRSVTTKDVVIGPNGFPVAQTKAEPAAPNGVGYGSGYVKTNNDRLPVGGPPAIAAIEAVAPTKRNLFADANYVAKPRFASSLGDMFVGNNPQMAFSPDMTGADPWGKMRGPSGASAVASPGYAYGKPAAAAPAAAPAAPKGLLQTLADMFTGTTPTGPGSGAPGWNNPNITYSPSNMTSTAVDGSNQSFNPPSMQQSSRWNGGY